MFSCAKVSSPPGIPEDLEPLRLVSTSPAQFEKNVPTSTVIEFRFTRSVRISSDDIYISPRIKGFNATVKGKSLIIRQADLEKNRTYLITLGPSLRDRFNKEPDKPVQLVFSTGNILDTTKIEGYVIDSTLSPKGGIIVGIFNLDSHDIPDTISPIQFTITDRNGFFSLIGSKEENENIKIIAFADLDKSLSLSTNTEPFGILSDISRKNKIILITSPGLNKIERIDSGINGDYTVEFSKGLIWVSEKTDDNRFICYISPERNNIVNMVPIGEAETTATKFKIISENLRAQLVEVNLKAKSVIDRTSPRIYKAEVHFGSDGTGIKITLSEPADDLTFELMGKGGTNYTITKTEEIDAIRMVLYTTPAIQFGDTIIIRARSGKDIAGNIISTEPVQIIIPSDEQIGTMRISIEKLDTTNIMLYLLSEKYTFVFPIGATLANIKDIPSGVYKTIAFIDKDKSRTYTAFDNNLQSEPLLTPPKTISIRKNWITELNLSLE